MARRTITTSVVTVVRIERDKVLVTASFARSLSETSSYEGVFISSLTLSNTTIVALIE